MRQPLGLDCIRGPIRLGWRGHAWIGGWDHEDNGGAVEANAGDGGAGARHRLVERGDRSGRRVGEEGEGEGDAPPPLETLRLPSLAEGDTVRRSRRWLSEPHP